MPKTVAKLVKAQLRLLHTKLKEDGSADTAILAEFNKMTSNFSRLQEIINQGEPEMPQINSETGYRRGFMRGH